MNYRYYIPDDGETIDDAVPVTHQMWDGSEFVETDDFSEWVDVEDAAEHAAEEC